MLLNVRGLSVLLALVLAGCSDLVSNGYEYGALEVQATRRNGEPVPGARLILYTWRQPMAYGTTDVQGRHVFDFVPKGEYGLTAVPADGYVTFTGHGAVARDGVKLDKGETQKVEFTFLKPGPGSVDVVVRRTTGQAVEGVKVFLYSFRGDVGRDTTGTSGRVEFRSVPFGNYGVRIEPPLGYAPQKGERDVRDNLWVDDGSQETLTFVLERCEGIVRVRATEAGGRPVAGLLMTLYTFRGPVREGRTNAAGELLFAAIPCANYGLSFDAFAGYSLPSGIHHVDNLAIGNGTDRTLDLTLQPCFGRVEATVVTTEGLPVRGAEVVLYTWRGINGTGRTDATGFFRFSDIPCGEYGARVTPPAGFTVREGRGSSFVDGIKLEKGSMKAVRFTLTRS